MGILDSTKPRPVAKKHGLYREVASVLLEVEIKLQRSLLGHPNQVVFIGRWSRQKLFGTQPSGLCKEVVTGYRSVPLYTIYYFDLQLDTSYVGPETLRFLKGGGNPTSW